MRLEIELLNLSVGRLNCKRLPRILVATCFGAAASAGVYYPTMKRAVILVGVLLLSACSGGSSPTTPTPTTPVVVPPPPVTTPPVVTPPATPYAGAWTGSYVIERCDGTGSVQDYFCRGFYPVGSSLPILMELSQSGTTVTGLVSFGEVRGTVSGIVRSGNILTLQGTASGAGGLTLTITYWDTQVTGTSHTGFINYDARATGTPGVASVSTRLLNVRK